MNDGRSPTRITSHRTQPEESNFQFPFLMSTTRTTAARLSLRGRVFAFHGVERRRRERWTRQLQSRHATVCSSWRQAIAQRQQQHGASVVVFVLTDYWADTAPVASSTSCSLRNVTEFWLREVLRGDAWISPDAHPFYSPPPSPPPSSPLQPLALLSYPMDYDATLESPDGARYYAMLPCSPLNKTEDNVPLWPYIVAYLHQPTTTTKELLAMLKCIIGDTRHPLNCLQFAIEELLSPTHRRAFFSDVLPTLKRLILDLPFQFRQPIRLLTPIQFVASATASTTHRELTSESVDLSRVQLLSLLSCSLLAVCPAQTHVQKSDFPWFNMEQMLSAPRAMTDLVLLKAHKIRTILEYFLEVVPRFLQHPADLHSQIVSFTRVAIHVPPPCASTTTTSATALQLQLQALSGQPPPATTVPMSDVRIETSTWIEDLHAHLQIDFANKYAGGGVMNAGAVQEEIRFILSPELLVACLVFAKLEPHESFVVHGTERFSSYTGYGGSYRFSGSVQDATPIVDVVSESESDQQLHRCRRRQSVVVGIDAISYGGSNVSRQYSRRCVQRDLVKALVGFAYPEPTSSQWPIATGNWGCGVFRGDAELKFVIQWLAASLAQRPSMVYVVFETGGDLQDKMEALLQVCGQVDRHAPLAEWMLEFLYQLENAGPPQQQQQQRSHSRSLLSLSGGRQRGRSAVPPQSVLERAVAFVQRKAAAVVVGAAVAVAPVVGSAPAASLEPSSASASTSKTPTTPTTAPAKAAATATTQATTPTTPSSRMRRSSTATSPSGPQLKQPKLTSYWGKQS